VVDIHLDISQKDNILSGDGKKKASYSISSTALTQL
jgi:hypothetical protein